jgi:hypothetical protein
MSVSGASEAETGPMRVARMLLNIEQQVERPDWQQA